ncbi:MAG: U32 family peptidase [Oscillospiraceae bacterium]|nr:U32 family peptidase [Oscillospiraceae bacterium]
MLELLSPAGSPEAVIAAVQNGADAIYLGLDSVFNARRNAKNFGPEEYREAVKYCRQRGCKVYVTLNTLCADRELETLAETGRYISDSGADAVLVQDLGAARVLRQVCPELTLHASTQMSVHNLAGVCAAAELGFSRVVLARELNKEQIRFIARNAPIEVEVFVHGALCFCHSGQCYLSALIGRRSGNRGLCAQPCRMQYSMGRRMDGHPLSLKDNCLVEHLAELDDMGVKCVKIEGRMKRPEYSAIVTRIYHRAIRDAAPPTEEDMAALELAFSRDGFTDGYFTGKKQEMHGVRGDPAGERDAAKLFTQTRRAYRDSQLRRVGVDFYLAARVNQPSALAVIDEDGFRAIVYGATPRAAVSAPLTQQAVSEQLYKTGGTQFWCRSVQGVIDEGLYLSAGEINALRRDALAELNAVRATPPKRRTQKELPPLPPAAAPERMLLAVQVRNAAQLTRELAAAKPDLLYVPLEMIETGAEALGQFFQSGVRVAAVLPRILTDTETEQAAAALRRARSLGIDTALVGNLGQIALAQGEGFRLRGDFGLNVFNSQTVAVLQSARFESVTASFELRLAQVRDLVKPIDTELIVYGRLPCMVTDQDILTSAGMGEAGSMSDRVGSAFPILRESGGRNVIYNAHKLFLADKPEDLAKCGLAAGRLLFTTESPRECVQIVKSYRGESGYQPNGITRGLYYRGVE